jgi:hypothetical protein
MKANVTNLRETERDMMRKDNLWREIAVIDPATGAPLVTARLYIPHSVAYACIWISGRGNGTYGRGTGKAGGYGYHKPSAALSEAIDDAGISLDRSISGVGDTAMRDACEAIARAVSGKRRLITHVAHA